MKLQIEAATLGSFSIDTSNGNGTSVVEAKKLCTFYERDNCPHRIENIGGRRTLKPQKSIDWNSGAAEDDGNSNPIQLVTIRAGCGTCELALRDHQHVAEKLIEAGLSIDKRPDLTRTPGTVLITGAGVRNESEAGIVILTHNPMTAQVGLKVEFRPNIKAANSSIKDIWKLIFRGS